MKQRTVSILTSLTLAAFMPLAALAQETVEVNGSEAVSDELIIKFKTDNTTDQALTILQHGATNAEQILDSTNNADLEKLYTIKTTGGLESTLEALNHDPRVEYAEPNYIVHADLTPNDTNYGALWGLHNWGQSGGTADADTDAPEAWDVTVDGSGVVVGVIDTGIDYEHEDLAANIWTNPGETPDNGVDDDNNGYVDDLYGWDFINDDNDPTDDHSHGTHVAGTIAGVGNNGIGVVGVHWTGKIAALKFLGSNGSGPLSDAIEAIQYAIDMGFAVTNNSWSGSTYSQALYDVIASANDAGQLLVAAAGNNYWDMDAAATKSYPAYFDLANIISVAASTRIDVRSDFSNWGLTSVDLAAPGSSIYSTTPNNTYGYKSGTSMASPHVAGAAALVWSYQPDLTAAEVKSALLDNVDPVSAFDGLTVTGGRLNINNAIIAVTPAPPPPPINTAPTAVVGGPYTAVTLETFTIDGSGSTDPEGDTLSFTWNMGDGTVFTTGDAVITHSYGAAGEFTITLTVNDGEFDSDPAITTATITDPPAPEPEPTPEPEPEPEPTPEPNPEPNPEPEPQPEPEPEPQPEPTPNVPPIAEAGEDQTAVVGAEIILDGSASTDQDGSITTYVWDFGDGKTNTGVTIPHAYAEVGIYTVVLTVTDSNEATDTDTLIVNVTEEEVNPVDEVQITLAKYNALRKKLRVQATSSAAPDAVLTVEGFGEMLYKKKKGYYELIIPKLEEGNVPTTVTVSSSEGGEATTTTITRHGKKWKKLQRLIKRGLNKKVKRLLRSLNR